MVYDHWPDLLTDCLLLSKSDVDLPYTFPDGSHGPGETETSKDRPGFRPAATC